MLKDIKVNIISAFIKNKILLKNKDIKTTFYNVLVGSSTNGTAQRQAVCDL